MLGRLALTYNKKWPNTTLSPDLSPSGHDPWEPLRALTIKYFEIRVHMPWEEHTKWMGPHAARLQKVLTSWWDQHSQQNVMGVPPLLFPPCPIAIPSNFKVPSSAQPSNESNVGYSTTASGSGKRQRVGPPSRTMGPSPQYLVFSLFRRDGGRPGTIDQFENLAYYAASCKTNLELILKELPATVFVFILTNQSPLPLLRNCSMRWRVPMPCSRSVWSVTAGEEMIAIP